MHIRTNHLTRNIWYLNLHDAACKDIQIIETIKFLGVHVDSHLTWNEHIHELSLKLKKYVYLMKKLVKYCDIASLKSVYFSYFQSQLLYCLPCWGSTFNCNVIKIFRLQKKIVRIMTKKSALESCRPLFKELHILPFPSLIIRECCLSVKRNLTIHDFKTMSHRYETRVKHNSKVATDNMIRSKAPSNFCKCLYNKLPEKILQCTYYNDFKRQLDKFLYQEEFYSIEEFMSTDN